MPQIVDETGQTWIVSEHEEHDVAAVGDGLRAVDELKYATLSFRTPDGRHSRILRRCAPLDWRYRTDDVLCVWLQIAQPVDLRSRR